MTTAPAPRPSAAPSRLVDPARAAAIRAESAGWPDVVLDQAQLRTLELLGTGALHPLDGPMDAATARVVEADGALPDGTPWPGPVQLVLVEPPPLGEVIALRDAEGDLLAALHVDEVTPHDLSGHAVAGRLEVVQRPTRYDLTELRLTPQSFAADVGADRVVVTERPLDAAQVRLAREGGAVHVLALDHPAGPGRVGTVALVRALEAADVDSVTVVPAPPGPAGEWAGVLAANHGAAPVDLDGATGEGRIDDRALGEAFARGAVPEGPAFPEPVAEALRRRFPPPSQVGFTLLLTGLSGSGKSTVANALAERLRAGDHRRVTLLDGDLVRTHLSSELGFSRAHRDLNVTRIGFVAAEVTRHGGIAICAPIAPYAATRATVRGMVEAHGRFVLVHVATPLEVCEARDRKGLYAKARAGLIAEFTGISDPYETPTDAEVVLDTTEGTPADAAAVVEAHLRAEGLIA